MGTSQTGSKRFIHSALPAFLLAVSVGQIYAFTNFSTEIARFLADTTDPKLIDFMQGKVQMAFSWGIFFLGMGAAFFGKIVERNIRLSTFIGTILFIAGMSLTGVGIQMKSLAAIKLGYGLLVGLGTGIIYISPVKTMMLWYPENKALAAALPIISFGLGSTVSTVVYKGFSIGAADSMFSLRFAGFGGLFNVADGGDGIAKVFFAFAVFYAIPMAVAALILRKPRSEQMSFGKDIPHLSFSYKALVHDSFFRRSWLFMVLNISAGLCLIPLAKQMMKSSEVGYAEGLASAIVALCGLMNGGGRFAFAWWSDRLAWRINILLAILSISSGVMLMSFWPPMIGLALLVINACYGAGFSVIPAILADHYGMTDISKIHGAVLSAWGFAGLAGNQAALLVKDRLGLGYHGVVAMILVLYLVNLVNARAMCRKAH